MSKLKDFNKWMKDSDVPSDRDYTVVIPKGDLEDFNTLWLASNKKSTTGATLITPLKETEINGMRAVIAPSGETITSLANKMEIDLSDFIRWNDVSVDSRVAAGQTYYLQRKIKTSNQSTHTVKAGEDLWTISQHYGIRLKSLKRLNRDISNNALRTGTVVYLADLRGNYRAANTPLIELDHNSPFEWGITGKSELDYVIQESETTVTSSIKRNEVTISPAAINSSPGSHTVLVGETLYSIATKYGVTVSDIQKKNGLGIDTGIQPGQVLKLFDGEPVETPDAFHEVKATDTIYSVARQYGLSVKELMDLNNKRDFDIKPGQKLIIK
jgi:membrane-bound lytic murein transglycosylase D